MFKQLLSKAKVLIVDDEPSNVRLLERIVEMFGGTQFRSTTDSRQALPLYFEFEPDLVLLDLHMPHLDGFQIIEQLQAAIPPDDYLPILVLTADITVDTKRRALATGAKDLVTKPLDNFEVVLRMKNLLENRFLHLELQKQNVILEEQVRDRTAQLEATLAQLRATQESVVKQERLSALGMMAGGIAHDFNNSLTMMLGYGELLLPYLEANAPERELDYLHHVIHAAKDATHVVSRLRDFYRPASGDEIRVAVDVNALVERAASLTSPKWRAKSQAEGIQITLKTELGDLPQIAANGAELSEALTNLIFNAVDAMPKGGTITLSTGMRDGRIFISIADTGIGMTEAERERCLEPFFTTKGERGTGLGLSVVYGIVQRHGGTITIESEKSAGTTFTITLPAVAANTEPVEPETITLDRHLRILVADDQEIICELIREQLLVDGHEVEIACDGIAALAAFESETFDLVITDQSMPGMSGEQLAKAIEERSPDTPVILLTGFGEEMHATGSCPDAVDLVVSKPVSGDDLRNAIRRVAAKQHAAA